MKIIQNLVLIAGCLALLLSFLAPIEAYGQGGNPRHIKFTTKKVAQAGFTFLEIGVGARVEGMGAIGSVLTSDPVSIFWNPAGIGTIESKIAVYAGYTPWFAGITQQNAALTYNLDKFGVFGLGFINMNYGTIHGTEIVGDDVKGFKDTGSVSDVGDMMIGLSYARAITDRLTLGGTVKYVYESLTSNYSASIIAFDVGTIYDTRYKGIKIAMSAFNVGKQYTYIEETTELPLTFRVGVVADMGQVLGVNLPDGHGWILGLEGNNPRDYSERIHIGTEYIFAKMIALRSGYKFNYDYESFTLGFGIEFKNVRIDYAFNDFGEYLGNVNRVSLNAAF